MDLKQRKIFIQQNTYGCKFGIYQKLPIMKSQKNFYNENFNVAPPYEYCSVTVRHSHPIDIAYEFSQMGDKPVVVNTVSSDFNASNLDACEGFKDYNMNLRTSFVKTVNALNLFPLNGLEVVYAPRVYIIRDDVMNPIPVPNVGKMSMITVSLIDELKLQKKHFQIDDYVKVSQIIETIFQTAIIGGNDVLIFNDIGCKTNNYPVEDVVDIINGCIYKYGHMFKHVVIGLFVRNQAELGYNSYFNEHIIHPQKYIQEYINNERMLKDELQHELRNEINEQTDMIMGSNMNIKEQDNNPFIIASQVSDNINPFMTSSVIKHQNNDEDDELDEIEKIQKKISKTKNHKRLD